VTLTIARSLGEFGALLVVSGDLIDDTQTATLYIHDGIESFQPDRAYAVGLVLAGLSFGLLVGMDRIRTRLAVREGVQE
jgi:sulfate transport system permease protein